MSQSNVTLPVDAATVAKITDAYQLTEYSSFPSDDVRFILAELSKTHVIVPMNQPGQERNAAEDLAKCEAATKGPWTVGEWLPKHLAIMHKEDTGKVNSRTGKMMWRATAIFVHDTKEFEPMQEDMTLMAESREMAPYWIKQCLLERAKNTDFVAHLEHIQEYWNGSRTDGAMSDALDEILHTCEVALKENPS